MIYLDNSATTKVRAEVLAAMLPYLQESFGNPSSIHSQGRSAREAVQTSRAHVAGNAWMFARRNILLRLRHYSQ